MFADSSTFAPLLEDTRCKRIKQDLHQREDQKCKNKESEGRFFKMGHGGTLDPLASGVLIIGVGNGTKELPRYLGCSKTYETVILFGKSTDSYDMDGKVTEEAEWGHITPEVIESQLCHFRGTFKQSPPVYSALKINGIKACDYIREGRDLPRALAPREVHVHECTLTDWMEPGSHNYRWPGPSVAALFPAARLRITVSSGFYVRSFAHDVGIACGSLGTMAALQRTRQAAYTVLEPPDSPDMLSAIRFADFQAGEQVWSPKIKTQLVSWMQLNPDSKNQRSRKGVTPRSEIGPNLEGSNIPKQRFRGEWLADTKQGRIKQQGGKVKGKYNQKRFAAAKEEITPEHDPISPADQA